MQGPLVEIKDLSLNFKVFGGLLKVLDGVNFTVGLKENVGLIGETGCGKTTTMKAIMRILGMTSARISKGEILFKGRDILKMNKAEIQEIRRKRISMIFQDPTAALNPVFTIGSQIKNVIKYSEGMEKNLTKMEIKAREIEVLRDVMLPDPERILESYPIQLSGGMRQRVCIAIALLSNLDLLIADEPGTSLDVTIQDQVLRLLKDLVKKKHISIILISHALGMVKNMTQRTYVMYAGSMVEVAKTAELFTNPLHPYSQALIAAVPKLIGGGISQGIPGYIPRYLNPPPGCRFHPRCSYVMPICKVEKPPFFKVKEIHQVACWLFKKGRNQVDK
jgi:peptide/nickel transport system ATP-binding protein